MLPSSVVDDVLTLVDVASVEGSPFDGSTLSDGVVEASDGEVVVSVSPAGLVTGVVASVSEGASVGASVVGSTVSGSTVAG